MEAESILDLSINESEWSASCNFTPAGKCPQCWMELRAILGMMINIFSDITVNKLNVSHPTCNQSFM
jgi:hypothetical protein